MSMFFCQGCQRYRDSDHAGINDGDDGQYCDKCQSGETEMNEMESLAKQVDGNSIDIMKLEKRIKDVEEKQ